MSALRRDADRCRVTWRLVVAEVTESASHVLALSHSYGRSEVTGTPQLAVLLAALCTEELGDDEVAALVAATSLSLEDPPVDATLAQFLTVTERLPGLVERAVYDGDVLVARLTPLAEGATPLDPSAPDVGLTLSRFAYLRTASGSVGLTLASPLALHRAELGAAGVDLVRRAADGALEVSTLDAAGRAAAGLLRSAGLLVAEGSEGRDARLETWSFHDLLFHSLSRPGRSDEPFGAHFAHQDVELPPALPSRDGPRVALSVPAYDDVVARDVTLTEAMEGRHSVRRYDARDPSAGELGELLWRVQRARALVPVPGAEGFFGVDRPYPSGGLSADVELHLVVSRCGGLDAGLYVYDAATHELVLEAPLDAGARLLADARVAAGGELDPPVLVVLTSRFARVSWKYERIAYALTLKHVGITLQSLYLVATSMGLGACALGSGNATAAAAAFGLDWLEESSVGELALGVDPAPRSPEGFVRLA